MDRTLLLVDDEENILRALKRLLRRDGYNILTANSGRKGLEVLESNEVGVIISDQRMPEMSGVEFLSQVKERFPNNVRMVLSGYTDLKSVTDAINEGAIYKFLTKPWDDDLIRTHVREAFEHFEMARENQRLSRELKQANQELQKAFKEKSRLADLNLSALQVAQEVLQNLPVAVLGIGQDDMIAVANLKAHELLLSDKGTLVGCFASQALPQSVAELYQQFRVTDHPQSQQIELNNQQKYEVIISPLGRESNARGSALVIRQTQENVS